MAGDGVEGDGESDGGRGRGHDDLDEKSNTGDDFQRTTTNDAGHVDDVDDMGMTTIELLEFKSSIPRKTTDADNGDDTRDDAKGLENTGKRQDTETDLVGEESKDGIPFAHVSEVLAPRASAKAVVAVDGDVGGRLYVESLIGVDAMADLFV